MAVSDLEVAEVSVVDGEAVAFVAVAVDHPTSVRTDTQIKTQLSNLMRIFVLVWTFSTRNDE